jgi:hypothetical protein
LKPPIISDYKWTARELSENNIDLELSIISHSLWNVSSTNQRRDTLVSFCNSEPNISNNTEDLVVDDASKAEPHLSFEQEGPWTDSLHQNISKSLENNSTNIYPRNGHSTSPNIDNLDYFRYRKRMGGGHIENEDTFDDDLAKMMDVACKCNMRRIPGSDIIIS